MKVEDRFERHDRTRRVYDRREAVELAKVLMKPIDLRSRQILGRRGALYRIKLVEQYHVRAAELAAELEEIAIRCVVWRVDNGDDTVQS